MSVFTGEMLKELAYFYTNTDRSMLEEKGLIQTGKAGDGRWKRFNHNFDIFILKLSDDDRAVLAKMATDYARSFDPLDGWIAVTDDMPLETLQSINLHNQVLAYEKGRQYNAWLQFEASEGGWFWMDDADSEPNPSHYRPLPIGPGGAA